MQTKIKIKFNEVYNLINKYNDSNDNIKNNYEAHCNEIASELNSMSGYLTESVEQVNKVNIVYSSSISSKISELLKFIEDATKEIETKDNELSSQIKIENGEIN